MLFTDAPPNWHAGAEADSFLHTVLVFVGIPLTIVLIVALLAAAGSIIGGGRNDSRESSENWFGDKPVESGGERRALPAPDHEPEPSDEVGGASARW